VAIVVQMIQKIIEVYYFNVR